MAAEPALPPSGSAGRVLVVDDDEPLTELVSEWVEEKWHCRVVNDGGKALDVLDDPFDVVLLDRQMPSRSGDEVLRVLRKRGFTEPVLMVSGERPDFDLLELPFDDYLVKPVGRTGLQEKIEELLVRRTYVPMVRRYCAAVAKLDLLERSMPSSELAADDRFLALRATVDELRQSADATLGSRTPVVAGLSDAGVDD